MLTDLRKKNSLTFSLKYSQSRPLTLLPKNMADARLRVYAGNCRHGRQDQRSVPSG